VGLGARLGAFWPALPRRWRGGRRAHSARGLGRLFGAATPGGDTYGYGAGFWTNRGTTGGAAKRIGLGMPPDSFMARGTQGQYIVILPSARLVVVRLGMAHDRYEDIDGVARLVADAIAAEAK